VVVAVVVALALVVVVVGGMAEIVRWTMRKAIGNESDGGGERGASEAVRTRARIDEMVMMVRVEGAGVVKAVRV
jgi:hypothetical protein